MIRAMSLQDGPLEWTGQSEAVWVDVNTPDDLEVARLQASFNLNPIALEDALQVGHWSAFDVYPEHLFLIVRTLAEPRECQERTERVSFFWYPQQRALITVHLEPIDYLDKIWHATSLSGERRIQALLYDLLDSATDTFFEFADAIQERTDDLEERLFSDQRARRPEHFSRSIFEHKRKILHARRLCSNARESVAAFSRHAKSLDLELAPYFQDLVGNLTRVYETLDSAREVLSSVLDVHLNVQSNRMNEIMKTLTTVSTVFLPLTFMAGVWGMNFQYMPELGWPYGYALAWASFLAIALALAAYFRRRGWW
ncbi:magnesium transporter [Deinobacterium chartae]|uniref:Magnesium transport protein CorA n=1 Tax=Deinobacterium chartae TaxID=521158 RepID=A0A841I113_9DEIO|nr:magnesium/cobalt transporter CorA [Deinobacterium chartae]MBB6097665.1 magnesium transporter [Deinobacterium chartae]